jgi:hypothetical protein
MSIGPPYSQPFENGLRLVIRRTTIGFLRGAFAAEAPQVLDSATCEKASRPNVPPPYKMKVRAGFRYVSAARPPRKARERQSHFRKLRPPI